MPPKKRHEPEGCFKKDMEGAIREKGFTHIATSDDGNCLYHSIRKYATKIGDHRFDGKSSDDLRKEVAVAMKEDIDTLVIFSGNSNSNIVNGDVNIEKKKARISKAIDKYATDLGEWAAEIGDQAPIYASKLFNVRLHIHRWSSVSCAFVQDTVINPRDIGEGAPAPAGGAGAVAVADDDVLDIHLVHIDNVHYEVMFPKKEVATRKKPVNIAKETMKTLKQEAKKAGIRVKGRTNEAIMNNLQRVMEGIALSSGSSSSSGKPSAIRRSRRVAAIHKRPPTPPRPVSRPNTKKGESVVAPSEESNTNSGKSVASVKPKGSGTRKKSQVTLAKMRGILESIGTNTKGLNANTVRALYASIHNA